MSSNAFAFHIVNFPSAPAYGVYASQLICYASCCSNYSDFLSHHRALVTRLLSRGYKVNRLPNTFRKFYGKHTDLVGQYIYFMTNVMHLASTLLTFPLCQAILHQHQPMVSMHLSSFAMPVVAQIIVTFY